MHTRSILGSLPLGHLLAIDSLVHELRVTCSFQRLDE
jgi:hypothetical protein